MVTAAFGSAYQTEAHKLIDKISDLNIFDECHMVTQEDLEQDTNYWNDHEKFIKNHSRGYGLYLWKSYVIKKYIDSMQNGDVLLYSDACCDVYQNTSPVSDTIDMCMRFINMVKHSGILCAHSNYMVNVPTHGRIVPAHDRYWCKKDLINMLDAKDYIDTPQLQANIVFYYVCDKVRHLVNLWYTLSHNFGYHFINNNRSIYGVDECIDHLHDQAILSLLAKKMFPHSVCNELHKFIYPARTIPRQ